MPKLSIQHKDRETRELELAEGESVIGRDSGCDIVVDDSSVSRRHLKIRTVMGDAFLEDLGSANGSFVNGRLVKKCVLNDGDVIQIGAHELLYLQPAPAAPTGDDADAQDKTRLIKPGEFGPQTSAAQLQQRETDGMSPMRETASKAARKRPGRASGLYEGMRDLPEPEPTGFRGWLSRLFGRR